MKEELLNEEESLKLLKVNKAQLENYVREGKLSPLYQDSIRKFKLSEISKISAAPPPSPTVTPPAPAKEEPSFIKTQKEGSTRVIEPPKESTRIGVTKTGAKGSTFEAGQTSEKFLKSVAKASSTSKDNLSAPLLIVALLILAFSVFTLFFVLQGKELPQVNNILKKIGAILPIGSEGSEQIENQTNSLINSVRQSKEKADALTQETKEFLGEENK